MLKKLKSLFIVEEGGAKKQTKEKPSSGEPDLREALALIEKKEESGNPSSPRPTNNPSPKIPESTGKPAGKFVDKLLGAIEANNIEGFDYLEFKQSLQSLSNVEMEDGTRYKSAMAMAKSMGATEDKIISAAQHYLNILKTEQEKFETAFKAQETRQLSQRDQEIKSAQNTIAQKEQQIEQLKKEIEALNKSLESAKNDAHQTTAKIQATREGFYNAYHSVVEQIKNDIEAMNQYLR